MDVASKVTVEDDEERVAIVVAGHVWIRFRELNAVAGKSDIRFPEQMVMQGAPRRTAIQTGIRVDTNTFQASDRKADANTKKSVKPGLPSMHMYRFAVGFKVPLSEKEWTSFRWLPGACVYRRRLSRGLTSVWCVTCHDFRCGMGNHGLYCSPVKGKRPRVGTRYPPTGPSHSWDKETS